jgi:hypothetical protein
VVVVGGAAATETPVHQDAVWQALHEALV